MNRKVYVLHHYTLPLLPPSLLPHTHPVTARFAISFCRDGLKDVLNVRPSISVSTRHEGGSIACSLLPSTHTTADKENTLLSKGLATTLEKEKEERRIGKRRIGGKRVRVRREKSSYEGR